MSSLDKNDHNFHKYFLFSYEIYEQCGWFETHVSIVNIQREPEGSGLSFSGHGAGKAFLQSVDHWRKEKEVEDVPLWLGITLPAW